MAVSHVLSNAVPDATGTMTIWFGATTATVAATDVIRPSDWNSVHNQYMTVTGNTVGQSTFSGTNIVIGGGPNVTISGVNATRFDISAAAGGGGGSVNFSAGTTSNNLAAVTFANGNGVSFGLDGSTITATVATNYLTSQSNQNITAANGGFAFQTLSFSNANGVSFGTSAGSAITASVQTSYRASNDAIGLNTAQSNVTWTVNSAGLSLDARGYAGTGTTFNGANLSGSMTVNSNGVQLSMSAAAPGGGGAVVSNAIQSVGSATGSGTNTSRFAADDHVHAGVFSVGVSNLGNTAGDTRVDVGRFVFAGGNAVTLSQATAANALNTVSIVGLNQAFSAAGGASTFQTLSFSDNAYASWTNNAGQVALTEIRASLFANSNTTQSSSGTQNIDALTFAGAGIASVGITNGSVVISVPAGGGAGDGGVFAGVSNLGNTAGSTGTVSTGNFVLVGTNGISLSQSTGAAGSAATITIAGAAPLSFWANYTVGAQGAGTMNFLGQSNSYIQPMVLQADLSVSYLRVPMSGTTVSSSAATTANTAFSGSIVQTWDVAVYVRQTGANSLSLSRIFYSSVGSTIQNSLTANANGSQYTVTQNITYPVTGGTSSYSTSYATSQTRFDFSSNSLTLFTGIRHVDIPMATFLPASNYYIAVGRSSSSGTQGAGAASGVNVQFVPLGLSSGGQTIGSMGVQTNASIGGFPFHGSYTIAGGATTASLALSQISVAGNNSLMQQQFLRIG